MGGAIIIDGVVELKEKPRSWFASITGNYAHIKISYLPSTEIIDVRAINHP